MDEFIAKYENSDVEIPSSADFKDQYNFLTKLEIQTENTDLKVFSQISGGTQLKIMDFLKNECGLCLQFLRNKREFDAGKNQYNDLHMHYFNDFYFDNTYKNLF